MPHFVQVALGNWQIDRSGQIFTFVNQETGVARGVFLSESSTLMQAHEAARREFQLCEGDVVDLSFSWPAMMIGRDMSKNSPSYIRSDEELQLFMAVRADMRDLILRVKVVPEDEDNDSLSSGAAQHFGTGKRRMTMHNNYSTQVNNSQPIPRAVATPTRVEKGSAPHAKEPCFPFTQGEPTRGLGGITLGTSEPAIFEKAIDLGNDVFTQVKNFISAKEKGKAPAHELAPLPASFVPTSSPVLLSTRRYEGGSSRVPNVAASTNTSTNIVGLGTQRYTQVNCISDPIDGYIINPDDSPRTPQGTVDVLNEQETIEEIYRLWRQFGCGGSDVVRNKAAQNQNSFNGDLDRLAGLDLNTFNYGSGNPNVDFNPMLCQGPELGLTLGNSSTATSRFEKGENSLAEGRLETNRPSRRRLFASLSNEMSLADEAWLDGGTSSDDSDPHHDALSDMEISSSSVGMVCLNPTLGKIPPTSGQCSHPPVEGSPNPTQATVPARMRYGVDAPVPTVLYDVDAPPYFDEPTPEDEVKRAVMDVAYEGDEIFEGRVYKSKEEARIKIAIHAIHRRFHIHHVKSRPEVILVRCISDRCPWRVFLGQILGTQKFEVHEVTVTHTCSVDTRATFHMMASCEVIGNMMRSRYLGLGTGPRPFELRRLLRQEYSLNVSYWKAWRAREVAMDAAMGSAMGSYALVRPYFDLLLQSNPDSLVNLQTETNDQGEERFQYAFMALHASIRGYDFLRKVVVIDGAHLTGKYGGVLMGASAQDANYQVFPIAIGVVDSENDAAWDWYMRMLQQIIPDSPDLTFVSDRHASIYKAIRKVYPMASHGSCIVHLKRNILARYKSESLCYMVDEAARAYRVSVFNRLFGEIQGVNRECATYLENIGFELWTRSLFVGDRYNVMTSNVAESFNKVLLMAREFPIISIFESIRTTLVTWFALRREASRKEEGNVTPKVQEMIIENYGQSTGFVVLRIADMIYEVRDRSNNAFNVHLGERKCSCREFQLLKIPCCHAVAAAIEGGIRVESLASVLFSTNHWRMTYEAIVNHVPDVGTLDVDIAGDGLVTLRPPATKRSAGRPKKLRIASTGEFKRKGRKRCTRCRMLGHNKATCKMPVRDT